MIQPIGNDVSSDSDELVEAIELLLSLATAAEDIARRLHVPVSTVQSVVRCGRLPQQQLTFAWADGDEGHRP